MRSRLIAALSTMALLASGCGAAGAPTSIAATFGPYDRATVDRLVAQGLARSEALILAMTKVTVAAADAQSVRLIEAFPTGDRADVLITASPAAAGDPSSPAMTSAATATGFTFGFHYQIPGSALVTDRVQVIRGDGAAGPAARRAFARLPQPGALLVDDKPLLQVFMQATVTETSKAVFDEYVDKMQTFLKAEGTLDQFVQGLKAVGSIFEAEDLSAEYKKLSQRIDSLEHCAKNPTHPLTIKAYQQDPTLRARLLQQVDETRTEIKANAAAQFLGIMDSVASDLTKSKLLGVVIGAGTSVTKAMLDRLSEGVIGDLERGIVDCEKETPAPSEGTPPPAATPSDDETPPPGATPSVPGSTAPPSKVQGTISWDTTAEDVHTAGSITFIGAAFVGIGDYMVQPGSTYEYDYSDHCGTTHKSGQLRLMSTQLQDGVAYVGLVGGAGSPVRLFLILPAVFPCKDPPGPHPMSGAPACAGIDGLFTPGSPPTYEFSCALQDGASGSVHGTLTTSP